MKKLRLNIDDLEIESFVTTTAQDGEEGTVHANSVYSDLFPHWNCVTQPFPYGTCPQPTGGPSCGGTCDNTCPHTCNESCGTTCNNFTDPCGDCGNTNDTCGPDWRWC